MVLVFREEEEEEEEELALRKGDVYPEDEIEELASALSGEEIEGDLKADGDERGGRDFTGLSSVLVVDVVVVVVVALISVVLLVVVLSRVLMVGKE